MRLVGITTREAAGGVALVHHIVVVFVDGGFVEGAFVSLFGSVLLHMTGQIATHLEQGVTVRTLVELVIGGFAGTFIFFARGLVIVQRSRQRSVHLCHGLLVVNNGLVIAGGGGGHWGQDVVFFLNRGRLMVDTERFELQSRRKVLREGPLDLTLAVLEGQKTGGDACATRDRVGSGGLFLLVALYGDVADGGKERRGVDGLSLGFVLIQSDFGWGKEC